MSTDVLLGATAITTTVTKAVDSADATKDAADLSKTSSGGFWSYGFARLANPPAILCIRKNWGSSQGSFNTTSAHHPGRVLEATYYGGQLVVVDGDICNCC